MSENDLYIREFCRVDMPACMKMEFGSKHLKVLASLHLPSLDSLLLKLAWKEQNPWLIDDIVLLTRTLRPQVLRIHMEPRNEGLSNVLQSFLRGVGLVEFVGGDAIDFSAEEFEEIENKEFSDGDGVAIDEEDTEDEDLSDEASDGENIEDK